MLQKNVLSGRPSSHCCQHAQITEGILRGPFLGGMERGILGPLELSKRWYGSPKTMLIPENMGLSWLPNWLMAEFRTSSSFVPTVTQKLDSGLRGSILHTLSLPISRDL